MGINDDLKLFYESLMSLAALGTAYLRLAIRYGEWVLGTSILVANIRKAGYSRQPSVFFREST